MSVDHLNADIASMMSDPAWFPHRYDAVDDKVHLIRADRAALRAATFLTDEFLSEASVPVVVGRTAAITQIDEIHSPHFIFHSAYCCSTLLANALDIERVSFALKEPTILNDISGWRRRGGQPAPVLEALKSALSLLSRPMSPGEQMIIKPSNVINALAPALMAASPGSHAVLLYTPLKNYLASIAKKGMWGRLWVRELFVKLGKDGMTDYGFTPEEIMQQTDLQIAAIGWLAQHRLFAAIVERFGQERVKTLQSEKLLADPLQTMAALAGHFQLSADDAALQSTIYAGVFARNAKTGADFGATARLAEHESSSAMHREEIEKVSVWATAVAKAAGQDLQLTSSLV